MAATAVESASSRADDSARASSSASSAESWSAATAATSEAPGARAAKESLFMAWARSRAYGKARWASAAEPAT